MRCKRHLSSALGSSCIVVELAGRLNTKAEFEHLPFHLVSVAISWISTCRRTIDLYSFVDSFAIREDRGLNIKTFITFDVQLDILPS
jgi:hypothetical protein